MEADLVKRAGVPFTAVPAAGVAGVGARALPGNLWKLSLGFSAARRVIRKFRPDVLFFTGGYVAVPVALAARLPVRGQTRPRTLFYVPDIEPALAVRSLVRFADHIAVTTEDSRAYYPDHPKVTVTGYPVRPELKTWDPDAARRTIGLVPDLPTLLVLGGSRGARSINHAVLNILSELLQVMQVVHVSGHTDWQAVEEARQKLALDGSLSQEILTRYHAYPYLHEELGAAMTAADLIVSRAGASTLGELPMFGLPAILVPYPYAWRYQQVNARYLAEKGAAVVVDDNQLSTRLWSEVRQLMDDGERRNRMQQAMRALAQPKAASSIARILQDLAVSTPGKGREAW